MGLKTCKTCDIAKPLSEFYKGRGMADGYRGDCKRCLSLRKKAYTEENRGKIKASNKRYKQNNSDKIKAYRKEYSRKNEDSIREKGRIYRQENKERIKARDKAYRRRPEIAEARRRYRAEHEKTEAYKRSIQKYRESEKSKSTIKKYRSLENVKEKSRISSAIRRKTNPVKVSARTKLNHAIQSGLLVRGPCEVCGTDDRVEGHHDDYAKPLDVRWLCSKHHKEWHRSNKAIGGD